MNYIYSTIMCLMVAACGSLPSIDNNKSSEAQGVTANKKISQSQMVDEIDRISGIRLSLESNLKVAALLDRGLLAVQERKTKKAIDIFDEAIVLCEDVINSDRDQVLSARTRKEAERYMDKAKKENKSALLVNSECSDAYFFKGFAHVDLGKIDVAMQYVDQAVNMAPLNAMYVSELGHIAHISEQWEDALEIFQFAEYAANNFSPEPLRLEELARAKRGIGFSYIELGQLDAAEKKFKECLTLNKDDKKALYELQYIEQLRAKSQLKSM